MTALTNPGSRVSFITLIFVAILGAAGLWSYWTTLAAVANRWADDPQYSHGYLVPVFALYLLWLRRERLRGQTCSFNWLGLGLLGIAIALRLIGAYCRFDYLDQVSLLPAFAGLFLLAGSWPALVWSWPALAFLAFMIPLPHSVSVALSAPMQAFATTVSTFALQVMGFPAVAEGNVILLGDIELGIVEACSGLRMLVSFFALSTAVAMLIRKPIWEKCLIAATAVPIALASNVLRITITGVCFDIFGNHFGGAFFHDAAGYLMPFLGMAFLLMELWVLKTLLIERPTEPAAVPLPQRAEVNPVMMYRTAQTPRREKKAPTPPKVDPEPVPVEV
jgi:exosortase